MNLVIAAPARPNTAMTGPVLSFQDLRHAFGAVSRRLEKGVEGLDALSIMLKQRIQLETEYATKMQRIIDSCPEDIGNEETGTLRDAIDALKVDMNNEVRMRKDFVNSLQEDVYSPLSQAKSLFNARNIKYAHDTKDSIKTLRIEQSKWIKNKTKYEKIIKDAREVRTAYINARRLNNQNNVSSPTNMAKLESRVAIAVKDAHDAQEALAKARLEWKREHVKFDDSMSATLQGMESNELARMSGVSDALKKWGLFITNLNVNREYDSRDLKETMYQINVKKDLQKFMRDTLRNNPLPVDHSYHNQPEGL